MTKISSVKAKMWSRIGSRAVYGQAVLEVAEKHSKLITLSADLGTSSGLTPFMRKFPDRFFNVGIAEQNMIGIAAGLAKEGFIPFVSSFAPFLSMRASEQIRMELGYMELNVKVVALGSGLALSFLGNSHYGLEDMAIMRSIPNICIVAPADCSEIFKTIEASASYQGPVYIRLTGDINNPTVYQEDYEFQLGKSILIKEGKDVLIVANGTMVAKAVDAYELLKEYGITCDILNMHTIKPLDKEGLEKHSLNKKLIVSIEEHTVRGGLGSSIAELFSFKSNKPRHLILGLPDKFGKTAEYEWLLNSYGLTGEKISNTIINILESKEVNNDK